MELQKDFYEKIRGLSKKTRKIEALEEELAELRQKEQFFTRRNEYQVVHALPVDRICPSLIHLRRDYCDTEIMRLADSIRQHGLIVPITVRRVSENSSSIGGIYTLVSGQRRLKALKLLGEATIPCLIVDTDSPGAGFISIIENYHRVGLNFFEEAYAIAEFLSNTGIEVENAALKLSVSRQYIADKLNLMKFSPAEKELIVRNGLTEAHAHALLRIEDEDERAHCLKFVIERKMNPIAAEEFIDSCFERPRGGSLKGMDGIRRKLIIKDIRLFYNSVDRAVEVIQRAGIPAIVRKLEKSDEYELTITIPRSHAVGMNAVESLEHWQKSVEQDAPA